jgi:hypothetical protein
MRIARSTGAASGALIALLGIWGALIPFVGPYFDYSFGINSTWHYTIDRLWLDILPGAAALLAGLILLTARTRATAALGGWIAIIAGAWFAIGPAVSLTWESTQGPIGPPLYGSTRQMLELLGYFYLLGALIVALGAFALGRLAPARTLTPTPVPIEESPAPTSAAPAGEQMTTPRPTATPQQPARGRIRMPFPHRQRTRS